MNQRQQEIIYQVNEKTQISVADLAKICAVSMVTIRHDLNFLADNGYLRREHGYAVAIDSDNLDARLKIKFPLKQRIAEYAASLVDNGDTIFIEGGSTNALLARHLAYTKRITLITSSYYIAQLLKPTPQEVIVLGGEYQKSSDSVVGQLACLMLNCIDFDKAFIGIDGFSQQNGFSGRNAQRTELVNVILSRGDENIVITDSSKLSRDAAYPLAPMQAISRLITDAEISQHDAQFLRDHQIRVEQVK